MDLTDLEQFYIIDPNAEYEEIQIEARHIIVKWHHMSFMSEEKIAKYSEDHQYRPDTRRSIQALYNFAKTLPPETKVVVVVYSKVRLKAKPDTYRLLFIYTIKNKIIGFFDIKPLTNIQNW